jgi:hypothetical protein
MAKKQPRFTDTIETLKPYVDRALTDPEFRDDLKDALEAARELYGPLTKGNGNVTVAAKRLATDKKAQKQVKRAVEDLQRATATLQKGKKSKKRGRKMVLLAGIIVGALYNPWTGPQTRDWLLDQIAGSDDLEPLGDLGDEATETVEEAADGTKEAVKNAVKTAAKGASKAAETVEDGATA